MKPLKISVALNILALLASLIALNHKGGVAWIKAKFTHHTEIRDNRLSVFDALPITPDDTVFIGDSILALGEWSELMNDVHCKNRAVSGSTTADVLARLPDVLRGKPKRIIISCGINDVQGRVPIGRTISSLEAIRQTCVALSPKTKVQFLEIMPVNRELYRSVITCVLPEIHEPEMDEVARINSVMSASGFPVVSIGPLIESIGELSPRFTNDGLHLNGRGLVELAKLLKE